MAELYKVPAVRPPTTEELKEIATSHGFALSDSELEEYKAHITMATKGYNAIEALIPPTLPVKYPRTPGYKPEPEDNKYNAWFWRCDIQGANSGLLHGKKVGIKDSVCVAGVPLMNGSKSMQGFIPDVDATVVTRILDQGGRVVGKTSCEHMCFSGSSWTNDNGPVLNPHDPLRSTGGSSGGSAVAIQVGEVDMAIGGDQGGSVRIPASWCGIVGLKPTFGLVPYTGACSIETTVDHLGPMARTVEDCALMLQAIAGFDEGRDSRQPRDLKVPEYSKHFSGDVTGKKVGLLVEGFELCEADVQKAVKDAASKLAHLKVTVEDVSMPLHKHGLAIWAPISTDGAYQCMIKGNGVGYHYKGYYPEAVENKLREAYPANGRNWSDPLKMVAMIGTFMEKNYGSHYYARAQNLNMKLTQEYDKLLEKYDVLVMPTLPYKAPLLPKTDATVTERFHNALGMICNTAPFDITGHPALSMNAGMVEGLPIGLMIVGRQFDDLTVLQMANAVERAKTLHG